MTRTGLGIALVLLVVTDVIYGIIINRGDFYDLVISGTTHNSIYDEYLFAEDKEERELSRCNHKIIGLYAVAFLAKVLKGTDSALLDNTGAAPHTRLRVIKARR